MTSIAELTSRQCKIRRLQRRASNPDGTICRSLHGKLVNQIMWMGAVVQLEKLSYRALQRRFGKSVGMRAPGIFVEQLRRKAERAGMAVNEFPTGTTTLSQPCHYCGAMVKSSVGITVRVGLDLYRAFLAMCVDGNMLNADHARAI